MNLPEIVTGADSPDEIVDKFKEVYEELYNSADTSGAVKVIQNSLKHMIGITDRNQQNYARSGEESN